MDNDCMVLKKKDEKAFKNGSIIAPRMMTVFFYFYFLTKRRRMGKYIII